MTGIDPALVRGWLAARSRSRGLPAPVDDSGGWRVDTRDEEERRRYVFAAPGPGLVRLGATITEPRVFLKLCADPATLAALLPPRWTIRAANRMMVPGAGALPPRATLPLGYRAQMTAQGGVTHVTIRSPAGDLAASGHAAEGDGVFIYDRIRVGMAHRRRGLGTALMAVLATVRNDPRAREVLTATADGAALYAALGWRLYTPYTTAGL